jgi:hypothetical protein
MHMGNNEALLQKHSKQKNFAMKEFSAATENLKDMQLPDGASKEQIAQMIEQYLYIPQINPFDDHPIHIYAHNEYLLDKYWKFRSSGNPLHLELINRMAQHTMEHQQIVAQQQEMAFQKNLQAQMLLKGKTERQIVLSKMDFSDKKQPEKKGK